MRLDTEFIRLPLSFDVDRMQAEVDAIGESEWRPHPQGHPGNSALPLTAVDGDPLDDGVAGPMLPTPQLARCEYLQQVLASFETVIGRSRLMRLAGESEATLHSDTNYYWADRVRIHVPVRTDPAIEFVCNGKSMHMGAGEAWIFDAWQLHNVLNPTGGARVHLVADTVGSAAFWELVDRGERPFGGQHRGATPTTVVHRAGERPRLETERANFPVVMHPSEQARLADAILEGVDRGRSDAAAERALRDCLATGVSEWRALWARYAADREGWPAFERLRQRARRGARAAGRQGLASQRGRRGRERPAAADPPRPQSGAGRSLGRAAGGGESAACRSRAGPAALAHRPPLRPPDLRRRSSSLGHQPLVRGARALTDGLDRRR